MIKQYPLLPVGLDASANCFLALTEHHSMMQNSHFHHASDNGLQNMVRILFPVDGVTLTFWVKVNWDVSIALKHALIRVDSDAPMIHPQ
jgi:hypothetical protein